MARSGFSDAAGASRSLAIAAAMSLIEPDERAARSSSGMKVTGVRPGDRTLERPRVDLPSVPVSRTHAWSCNRNVLEVLAPTLTMSDRPWCEGDVRNKIGANMLKIVVGKAELPQFIEGNKRTCGVASRGHTASHWDALRD